MGSHREHEVKKVRGRFRSRDCSTLDRKYVVGILPSQTEDTERVSDGTSNRTLVTIYFPVLLVT